MEKHAPSVISVSPEHILALLAGCVGLLVTASLSVGQALATFNLDSEYNVPTFFSASLLLAAAVLLGLTALLSKKEERGGSWWRYWGTLSLLFLCVAIDESIVFHERAIEPLRSALGASGVFYHAWVILALPVLLVLGGVYARFLWALPRRTALLMGAAGLLYVGGAVGMEMVGGWLAEAGGEQQAAYRWATTIEETMEMVGAVVFIYALLDYLRARGARVGFGKPRGVASPATASSPVAAR